MIIKRDFFKKILASFIFLLFLVPSLASADGMVISQDLYSGKWDYSGEKNQQAFISHSNGLEKMIISIETEGVNTSDAVWIFPVPSSPEKIVIDMISTFPQLSGEDISEKAKANIDISAKFLNSTQIYTIPFLHFGDLFTPDSQSYSSLSSSEKSGSSIKQDVIVYEHLEKEGFVSEIITAKTSSGLYDYLKGRGLKIENGAIPILDHYIGKDFSFVVSWMNNQEVANLKATSYIRYVKEYSIGRKGLLVTFPTEDLYFPLLPTSVYGSKVVPATIRVVGHVSPKVFKEIKNYTKTEYYVGNISNDLNQFYGGKNNNVKYTKIQINAPSKYFTDDLWIKDRTPLKIYYSLFFANHPVIISLLLLVFCSALAGIIAGMIVFDKLRKEPIKLAMLGLFNCLSFCFLTFVVTFFDTKNKKENVVSLLAELKQRGYLLKRRIATILFAVFLFLFFVSVLALERSIFYIFRYKEVYLYDTKGSILILASWLLILILLLFVIHLLSRVRKKDNDLLVKLEAIDYSLFTLQPRDFLSKIIFLPIFSVVFLIISWLITNLLIFIV